jgi:hypothetical protein
MYLRTWQHNMATITQPFQCDLQPQAPQDRHTTHATRPSPQHNSPATFMHPLQCDLHHQVANTRVFKIYAHCKTTLQQSCCHPNAIRNQCECGCHKTMELRAQEQT